MMTPIELMLSKSASGKKELVRQDLIVAVTEQIWAAMEAAKVTKADLARVLGSSKSNITQLLCGDRNMTLSSLADIASALNLKVSVQMVHRDANTTPAHEYVGEMARHCAMNVVRTATTTPKVPSSTFNATIQVNSSRGYGRVATISA
jgi:DNA-binding Xre family transcriptional regulator